ncbi:MAG: zinc ribbon domain-containing protein [Thermoplasmata archaeon]|nr:zinc ribbon domain-containing protein [Thermoplasmata archaeon]MCJ7562306.1 zinc ribbon domain-containing protein [Thermoplasmata archaeon]TFG68023.1 MAG: zinc ribbon domain-containing protein [Methanomassiliicoccus sp.]
MDLTDEEKLIYIAILAVLMVFILYFELRVMRKKSKEVRSISIKKDEAYNAIHTCRSVIEVVSRQGSDVSESRSLVEKARRELDRGNYDTAILLCEASRDELTKARTKRPSILEGDFHKAEKDHLEEVAEQIVKTPVRKLSEREYTGTKLEVQSGPSYLAAKFEMNTARGEIEKASKNGDDVSAASKLLSESIREFDSGNYTKALSLSVRAKKALSAEADTIQLKHSASDSSMIEADRGSELCSSCGSVLSTEDGFCGKCGTRRVKVRVCQSCGREASSDDKFCRKCGFRVK